MDEKATLTYRGETHELPVVTGSENEVGIDIQRLRAQSGLITLDNGYSSTGSCQSAITYIDGEEGILRYCGYPIEQLAEQSTFTETAYLLMFGELPNAEEISEFRERLRAHQSIHSDLISQFGGFPPNASPMPVLAAMVNAAGTFEPALMEADDDEHFMESAARLMSKIRTIAAASYRKSIGEPINYPDYDLRYTANFLHMMFSQPNRRHEPDPDVVRALDQILILHADHEQNCSTSTVRMVGSSQANLYASVAAGICALWGPLHGGANAAVIDMLSGIAERDETVETFIDKVKRKEDNRRLMGFGHRVYKNFDPRARIIKAACDTVLEKLGIHDPLLDLAKRMEEIALKDPYFVDRRLYPNVDFYSGIILRAIGIPTNMFTVMFAIGRLPGWMAHWREVNTDPKGRIYRPRQIYTGATTRNYIPTQQRG